MSEIPQLDHFTDDLQLIDGNNFLLARFQQPADGLGVRSIVRDVKACKLPPVFVFDGFDNCAKRRAIYPTYKVRDKPHNGTNFASLQLVKSLLSFVPCVIVECPQWEADDVIAT
ncbi:MAG TPA: hypothetical protein PLD10_16245, partial [Rhodopila sp.]|nr:hypothetical protein [Rhodopila sp.]